MTDLFSASKGAQARAGYDLVEELARRLARRADSGSSGWRRHLILLRVARGLVLCSERRDTMAKITLPENSQQILAAPDEMYLRRREERRSVLAGGRDVAERALPPLAALIDDNQGAESSR